MQKVAKNRTVQNANGKNEKRKFNKKDRGKNQESIRILITEKEEEMLVIEGKKKKPEKR